MFCSSFNCFSQGVRDDDLGIIRLRSFPLENPVQITAPKRVGHGTPWAAERPVDLLCEEAWGLETGSNGSVEEAYQSPSRRNACTMGDCSCGCTRCWQLAVRDRVLARKLMPETCILQAGLPHQRCAKVLVLPGAPLYPAPMHSRLLHGGRVCNQWRLRSIIF